MAAPVQPNADWPVVAADAANSFTTNASVLLYTATPTFDVRNGAASTATSIFIKPTIGVAYHWTPVSGIRPGDGLVCLDAFVRTAWAYLADHPPDNLNEARTRKLGLCLGVARAVMTAYYQLTANDMIVGELAEAYLLGTRAEDGSYGFSARANLPAAAKARLVAQPAYSPIEVRVIPALIASAIGIPPLQGYSLVNTQHHYLSDPNGQSRKAYAAVEKQFWRSTDVEAWFNDDIELIQDALWHKSGHPISVTLKERLAFDERVAAMITTAGAGSAAARLPAVEADTKAASSYRTLFDTCKPLFAICGGDIDFTLLDVALDTLKAFPVTGGVVTRPSNLSPLVPATVDTRAKARLWLKQIVERNSSNAALCFGFYCSLTEQSQVMMGATGTDTLKSAYSLKKLKSSSHASYVQGVTLYGDYQAARQAWRQEGKYDAPQIVLT